LATASTALLGVANKLMHNGQSQPTEPRHSWLRNDSYILGKSFEAHAVLLHHGNGDVAGFAGLDVSDDASLAGVGTADDLATGAIFEFGVR